LKEMAEESIQNVSAIIKKYSDEDLTEKDLHVQFVQVGNQGVDGASASITVATAIISALEEVPIAQDLAMTGSLSVRGDVLPVSGVTHKIEAAAKAGIERVVIPDANEEDVMIEEEYEEQVEILPVSHISDVIEVALAGEPDDSDLADRLKRVAQGTFDEDSESGEKPSPTPQ